MGMTKSFVCYYIWLVNMILLSSTSSVILIVIITIITSTQMDVRNFVHIKRIPGSTPESSQDFPGSSFRKTSPTNPPHCRKCHSMSFISHPIPLGLVMTKNVIHKQMRSFITKARILIFDCPLENDEYTISSDHQGNQEIRRCFDHNFLRIPQ
jgi:hypothetical protein